VLVRGEVLHRKKQHGERDIRVTVRRWSKLFGKDVGSARGVMKEEDPSPRKQGKKEGVIKEKRKKKFFAIR